MSLEQAECALCGQRAELCESHIMPEFVSERIKQNSPTGYMRCARQIDRRVQDPGKQELLCRDCEDHFGKRERLFAEHVFEPFMVGQILPLQYRSASAHADAGICSLCAFPRRAAMPVVRIPIGVVPSTPVL